MSVDFDVNMTGGNSDGGDCHADTGVTSISSATLITIGGSGSLLVVPVVFGRVGAGAFISDPIFTWNSVAATGIIAGTGQDDGANSFQPYVAYWVSPATGSKTLAASWTGSADIYMGACSFTGTDTATGINSADTQLVTGSTSIAVNTTSDGATVAVFGNNNGIPTMNQTKLWTFDAFHPGGGSSYAIGGSGTNSHTFTGGAVQSILGIHIIAPAGPAVLNLIDPAILI